MNIDFKTLVDAGVIVATLFSAWQSNKVKIEILKMRLWIVNNFHAKEGANLSGDLDS
jgi:hypothetical protein